MSKRYSWYANTGIKCTIDVRPNWAQFHRCNAQTRHVHASLPDCNRYALISYATPIAHYIHFNNGPLYVAYTDVLRINNDRTAYTPTTVRQLAKWLREICAPYTYADVKHAVEHPKRTYNDAYGIASVWYDGQRSIWSIDRNELEGMYNNDAHYALLEMHHG